MPRTTTLYEALGGGEGVLRLAAAWHERVLADEIVAHAFSHGFHPQHTERLAAYWGEAWGGPATYSERYGSESSVVRIHSGNGPHEEMDRRAIACFDQAMDDIGIDDAALRRALHDYFAWATNVTMTRYQKRAADVPDGLRIPRWSWEGLEQPGVAPTLFEYMGGAEALHRLADAQYRRCLTDPVLKPLFGTQARPGHVEHLAAWLGEVFGGPDVYTRELGGHGALLRHHANTSITEGQRRRFVEAFMEAADEVSLPTDERFRRRFREYFEWGSGIAVAVSQPGADVTSTEPVPRWGWK